MTPWSATGGRADARARLALKVCTALLLAFFASLIVRDPDSYIGAVDGWGVAALELVIGLVCLGRYWERSWRTCERSAPTLPLYLGGACLCDGLGHLANSILDRSSAALPPPGVEVLHFLFYPLVYLGLMQLIRRADTASLLKTVLDGFIAALGAATLTAEYLFDHVYPASGVDRLTTAVDLAFPVADVLLLALAGGALIVARRPNRPLFGIIAATMAAGAGAGFYALLNPHTKADHVVEAMVGPVTVLALALAVWMRPADQEKIDNELTGGLALPVAGAGASMTILYSASLGDARRVAIGFATGTLLVALVRLAIKVREGQALKTARFRSLIDKAWDLIVVAEGDLEVAFVTPSAERILGYRPSELQGQPITAHIHPDDLQLVRDRLDHLPTDGRGTAAFEIRMRHRNGAWRVIAWTATNLLSDPSVSGYVLNGSDITEARRAAEDLAAARDGALLASKAKSDFLSTMSHEIRTPMNGVIGLTELLLTTTLDDEQLELASGIKISAESLLGIINDILDFSKIEAGKLELDESELDLRRIVDDVGMILATPAHKKGLELIVDIGCDVPTDLLGDAVRLQQVLLNLGSNAVKFTYDGEVVIRVGVLHQDRERVALRFEVIDQGIGIAPEDQQRLFRAFAQADSSTTRRFGGTGLGLAITRQLVDLMGGRLGLLSAPRAGSTFWFEVSMGRGQAGEQSAADRGGAAISGQRALVVDDNATNRKILREQLKSWGVSSVEACDAYEAIEIAAAAAAGAGGTRFDLGIIDLNMPGMDGMELAQILKSDPKTAGISLFLLSSSGQRLGVAESHLRGFEASLTKPVRSSELFDCLISNAPAPPGTRAEGGGVELVAVEGGVTERTLEATPGVFGMILLVEDNKMNQLVASKALTKLGYTFDIANDGTEAVAAIRANRYDAVLMDCQMPLMDGYEATGLIRGLEGSTRHTPIIAMTAAAMEGDREICLAAGMDDYVTKPVRLESIADALTRWIGRTEPPPPPAHPSDSATTTLDRSQLDVLEGLDDGDGVLLAEIFGQFLTQTREGRSAMATCARVGDGEALRRTAHTIKGSSANIGATGLAGICADIESLCRVGQFEAACRLLDRFDAELARVQEALSDMAVPVKA